MAVPDAKDECLDRKQHNFDHMKSLPHTKHTMNLLFQANTLNYFSATVAFCCSSSLTYFVQDDELIYLAGSFLRFVQCFCLRSCWCVRCRCCYRSRLFSNGYKICWFYTYCAHRWNTARSLKPPLLPVPADLHVSHRAHISMALHHHPVAQLHPVDNVLPVYPN